VDLVKLMIEIAGRGSYRIVPFPPERKRIDIGDFYSDSGKLRRVLGWKPSVSLRDGLTRTIDYYGKHKDHYL
jgi:UDP-glucose 4-epimerase